VHSGALGWVAMVTFGSFYHMVPRLYDTRIYSTRLIYIHFWLATIGILLYITSMWVAGIFQGLMLRSFDDFGNLAYTFVETVAFLHEPYMVRALAGAFFVSGVVVMAWNMSMTIRQSRIEAAEIEAKLAAKMANA
jgi:cytochrome c oxidase cbb3-type subunit 1